MLAEVHRYTNQIQDCRQIYNRIVFRQLKSPFGPKFKIWLRSVQWLLRKLNSGLFLSEFQSRQKDGWLAGYLTDNNAYLAYPTGLSSGPSVAIIRTEKTSTKFEQKGPAF